MCMGERRKSIDKRMGRRERLIQREIAIKEGEENKKIVRKTRTRES